MFQHLSKCKLVSNYTNWIISHSDYLDSIDNFSKVFIYFGLGRIEQSQLLTETCVSLSKIVSFINDQIIVNSGKDAPPSITYSSNDPIDATVNKIRVGLTLIDHIKVLLELTAAKLSGLAGKSTIIWIILILRSSLQYFLLLVKDAKLNELGPLPPLQKKDVEQRQEPINGRQFQSNQPVNAFTLTSGRQISGFTSGTRTHELDVSDHEQLRSPNFQRERTVYSLIGKAVKIAKPVLHFGLLKYFGRISWTPWLLALMTDILGLVMLSNEYLTQPEKVQFERWKINLALYLLRPPFFSKLISATYETLSKLKLRCPSFVFYIILQLFSIITEWHKIYFQTWE